MEPSTSGAQTCRTCGEAKPLSEFDARVLSGKRKTQCKSCRRKYQNERHARLNPQEARSVRTLGTTELLPCTRCRRFLPASAFPRRRRDGDELQPWCRACFAVVNGAYYYANRAHEIARVTRNIARARAAAREFVAAYLATHPCVDCGETDRVVLEFDHVGPKRMDISKMVAAGYPCNAIEAEIDKCEVRCGNDHRRKTEERRRAQAEDRRPVADTNGAVT